jgi:hypothetical protein
VFGFVVLVSGICLLIARATLKSRFMDALMLVDEVIILELSLSVMNQLLPTMQYSVVFGGLRVTAQWGYAL